MVFKRAECCGRAALWAAGLLASVHASAQGVFHSPAAQDALVAGATVEVCWNAACGRDFGDEMELLLSLDDGLSFPIRVTARMAPCASRFRWRIPDFTIEHARLAVRTGRKGHPESERILAISARFSVLGGASPGHSRLTRGTIEWWTDQALFEFTAEDHLDETLGGGSVSLAASTVEPDLDDSAPEPLARPESAVGRLALRRSASRHKPARTIAPRLAAPAPLRV